MATHSEEQSKIKVLLAKSDIDAHDRGVRYVAKALRDAGMEVIFIRYGTVAEVVNVAAQEDVDVIGLSFYGSGLMYDTSEVIRLLKENNIDDKIVIVGGTIPDRAMPKLSEIGVKAMFSPGVPIEAVIDYITENVVK